MKFSTLSTVCVSCWDPFCENFNRCCILFWNHIAIGVNRVTRVSRFNIPVKYILLKLWIEVRFSIECVSSLRINNLALCLVVLQVRHDIPPNIQRKVVPVLLVLFETLGKSFDIDKGFQSRVFSEGPQACIFIITETLLIKTKKWLGLVCLGEKTQKCLSFVWLGLLYLSLICHCTWMRHTQVECHIKCLLQCMDKSFVILDLRTLFEPNWTMPFFSLSSRMYCKSIEFIYLSIVFELVNCFWISEAFSFLTILVTELREIPALEWNPAITNFRVSFPLEFW